MTIIPTKSLKEPDSAKIKRLSTSEKPRESTCGLLLESSEILCPQSTATTSNQFIKESRDVFIRILLGKNNIDAQQLAILLKGVLYVESDTRDDLFRRMSSLADKVLEFYEKLDFKDKYNIVKEWLEGEFNSIQPKDVLVELSSRFYESNINFYKSISRADSDLAFLALLLNHFFTLNTHKSQVSLRFIMRLFLKDESRSLAILDGNISRELGELNRFINSQEKKMHLSFGALRFLINSSYKISGTKVYNSSFESLFSFLQTVHLDFFNNIFRSDSLDRSIQQRMYKLTSLCLSKPDVLGEYKNLLSEYSRHCDGEVDSSVNFLDGTFDLLKTPKDFMDFLRWKFTEKFKVKDLEKKEHLNLLEKLLLLKFLNLIYCKGTPQNIFVDVPIPKLFKLKDFLGTDGGKLGTLSVNLGATIRLGIPTEKFNYLSFILLICSVLGQLNSKNKLLSFENQSLVNDPSSRFLNIVHVFSVLSISVSLLGIVFNRFLNQKVVFKSSLNGIYDSNIRNRNIIRHMLCFGYGFQTKTDPTTGARCLAVNKMLENPNLNGGTNRPLDAKALQSQALANNTSYVNRSTFLNKVDEGGYLEALMTSSKVVIGPDDIPELSRQVFEMVALFMRGVIENPTEDASMKLFLQLQTACFLLPKLVFFLLKKKENFMFDRITQEIKNFFETKSESDRVKIWRLTPNEAKSFEQAKPKIFEMFSSKELSHASMPVDVIKLADLPLLYQILKSNGDILNLIKLFFEKCGSDEKDKILGLINNIEFKKLDRSDSYSNIFQRTVDRNKSDSSHGLAKLDLYINTILETNSDIVKNAQEFVGRLDSSKLINVEIKNAFECSPKSYIKLLIINCILFLVWSKESNKRLTFEDIFLNEDKFTFLPKVKECFDNILGFYGTDIQSIEYYYDEFFELISKILSILWGAGLQFANPAGAMNQIKSFLFDRELNNVLLKLYDSIECFLTKQKQDGDKALKSSLNFNTGSLEELLDLRRERFTFPVFLKWLFSSSIVQRHISSKQITVLPRLNGGNVEIFGAQLGIKDPWPFGFGPRACPAFGIILAGIFYKVIDAFLNPEYAIKFKNLTIVMDVKGILMNSDASLNKDFVKIYNGQDRIHDCGCLGFDVDDFCRFFIQNYQSHILRLKGPHDIEYEVFVPSQVFYCGRSSAQTSISVCKISNFVGVQPRSKVDSSLIFSNKSNKDIYYEERILSELESSIDPAMFDLEKCLESIGLDEKFSVVNYTYVKDKIFEFYLQTNVDIKECVRYNFERNTDVPPLDSDTRDFFKKHIQVHKDIFDTLNL